MRGPVWIVNDWRRCIAGTRTLWDDLLDWIPDSAFKGERDYADLAYWVTTEWHNRKEPAAATPGLHPGGIRAGVIIRNASYFDRLLLAVPTVALLQDIFPKGAARDEQIEVCRAAAVTVFNSEYTRDQYPELADVEARIIPLSVDFSLFRPIDDPDTARAELGIEEGSICWVGAKSKVKGWDVLWWLVRNTPHRFVIITKDEQAPKASGVRSFVKLSQPEVARVMACCRAGLCTSVMETQHLAGLEMGACGLPLVAPPVGAYYKREPGVWGVVTKPGLTNVVECLDSATALPVGPPREYWIGQGFLRDQCRLAWLEVVEYARRAA